jgi:Mor family transcriptional regulator
VSRNTVRTKARLDQLSDELAIGAAIRLRTDADQIKPIVDAVVAYLVEEYPSQDLYIPSSVTYPVAEIRADFSTMSLRALCKKYRADRRTIYRLLDSE